MDKTERKTGKLIIILMFIGVLFLWYGLYHNMNYVILKPYFYGLGVEFQVDDDVLAGSTLPTQFSWAIVIFTVLWLISFIIIGWLQGYRHALKNNSSFTIYSKKS